MFDEKELRENWQFLKAEVLTRWKRLAEVDVENAHGNLQALHKLVEKEYGPESNFLNQIQDIYDKCKNPHYEKTTRITHAGSRDNSAERKLNENFSRTTSPLEVKSGQTNSPTIHEESDSQQ